MTASLQFPRERRYLLREASEDECAVLEQEFFERPEAVDLMAAAEDDLIEDYLAGELGAADRDRFESGYLSTENHRVRVETIRRLIELGRTPAQKPRKASILPWKPLASRGTWLALAASLLIVGSVALWVFSPIGKRSPDLIESRAPQPAPTVALPAAPAPRVFALTISPVSVRGSGSDNPSQVIPAGTDVVVINFGSEIEDRGLTPSRATIRVVAGRDVWQGPVAAGSERPSRTLARVDVPAADLPPDDYLITLYGTNRSGAEAESAQYFLRVRTR